MKKSLIILLTISMMTLVSCKKEVETNKNDLNSLQELFVENDKTEELTEEEIEVNNLIELHQELLPKMTDLFIELGLDYSEYKVKNEYYHGIAVIEHVVNENIMDGQDSIFYGIGFGMEDNVPQSISSVIYEDIDPSKIKNSGFNIEESIVNRFAALMMKNDTYKKDIEEAINNYYKNGGDQFKQFTYENIDVTLTFKENSFLCGINVK